MSKIKVLIVDDHTLLRKGIRGLISREKDMEVVGEAADGVQAVRLAKEQVPDVVLMDIVMPELNGIQAAKKIKQFLPMIHILFFSGYDDEKYISAVLEVDAAGYLLKNSDGKMVLHAIRTVSRGDSIIHPLIMNRMLAHLKPKNRKRTEKLRKMLTKRQIEIVKLSTQGLSDKETAQCLDLSVRTIHAHWRNIFKKIGTRSRIQTVMVCLATNIISLEDNDTEK